jgi:hypothetical protein
MYRETFGSRAERNEGETPIGKRSDFARIDHDLYDTPAEAVFELVKELEPATRFIEPCVGNGYLVGHLKRAGHILVGSYDLPTDARTHRYDAVGADCFLTNPPYWGRPWRDLHALIANLSDQLPTWLLMASDWLINERSAAMMPRLRRIVAVGRMKWVPDSPDSGMVNVVWCLFGPPSDDEPRFVNHRTRRSLVGAI